MTTAARFIRHPSVELRKDGDGAVALHVDRNQYFELNASALFVWERLDTSPTVDALTTDVVDQFNIAEAEARSMITEVLETLESEHLVHREGERRRDRLLRRLLGR
jgi:hypothetical protein